MEEQPWSGSSVLIVDDSPRIREELTRLFREVGMNVVGTAENGVEALAQIDEKDPELVSLDIIMPEMDGIECYRKIQEREDTRRCMIVSCLAAEAKILDALKKEIPPHHFQAKPVTKAALEDRLAQVFDAKAPDCKPEDFVRADPDPEPDRDPQLETEQPEDIQPQEWSEDADQLKDDLDAAS